MAVNFINSEICDIDGEKLTHFYHPIALFNFIQDTLKELGSRKFFSSPSEKAKRAREGLPQYFFTLSLKKQTGKDWWVLHPTDPSSDFFLMSVDDNPPKISIEQFEQVIIPDHFPDFDEAFKVVQDKLEKGYPSYYNLLIFINNVKSKEWSKLLYEKLPLNCPFKTVGVVYLLFKEDKPYMAVVHKLRPAPVSTINANFSDSDIYKPQDIKHLMEEIKSDGMTFIKFKPDISREILITLKKFLLKRGKSN